MERFFDLFQLFALGLFILMLIGRSLFLYIATGINPLPLGTGKRGVQRIVELMFVAGFVIWSFEVLAAALPYDLHLFHGFMYTALLQSPLLKAAGVLVTVAAFIIYIAALVTMGSSWRMGIDLQNAGKLVTGGIFAFSRNPLYVAIDLYYIGMFLINGTLIFLVFALAVILLMHYQIVQEEKALCLLYGDQYAAYRRRTRRYF